MKQKLHITLTVLSGGILTCLLAGCPMLNREDIARNTTEYNLVAEQAGNEMLLLNIVRASKRRPMYFTSFGKLTGTTTFEVGTGGIKYPFGSLGGALDSDKYISPSAGYKYSPLFDLAVLDSQEFTNGIMKPVPMSIIEYYRSQGWPEEMLMHLFIRRIEIINPNAPNGKDIYTNYPENQIEFQKFQNQIRDARWDIEVIPDITKIGEVDANEASKLQNLINVQKAGLKLTEFKKTNKTQEKDKDEVNKDGVNKDEVNKNEVNKDGVNKDEVNKKMELRLSQDKYIFTFEKRGQKTPFSEEDGKIYTRSPEAILYYLGEILRAENRTENPYIPMIDVSHDRSGASPARLFYARKARCKDVTPCVSVDYEGTKYVIPGDPDGQGKDRSMHVLSLVSQLIGLQKKSAEAPATATVSVIGR